MSPTTAALLLLAERRKDLGFLREKIFQPLGMSTPGEITDHDLSDASAYTRYALGPPRLVAREGAGWMFAAGELAMTLSALARWAILNATPMISHTGEVSGFPICC
jgi:D-alanyl-D-alanine carboxypeptidase